MFRKKLKNFLILSLLGLLLFVLSSKTILAQAEEPLFTFSLNFQKLINKIIGKLLPPQEEDPYKEKYYELLQELAKLKLSLKEIKEKEIISFKEKYLPQTQEVEVLKKDNFGYIYVSNFEGIKEGMIVVDKNFVLVGKIIKVYKNYSIVQSLEVPNLEFNVTNLEDKLLGLGKTISNGFLEVDFVDPQMEIKLNDFVLTGEGPFPAGFVIGLVNKIYKNQFNQKIIVKLLFNSSSEKLLVIKK